MSKTEYQPDTSGDVLWTAFVIVVCLILFLHFAPMVLLGGAGLLLWRWIDCRHPLGKRHVLALFALSLMPAFLISRFASGDPLLGYFDVQQDVLNAGVRRAVGSDATFDAGVSLFGYLGQVLPTWLPGAVVCGTVISRLTRPKKSQLRVREATGIDVPKRVEKRLARGLTHPTDGWAIGYTPEGQSVAIGDVHARQHVVCGATGAGKTTVLRHLLDGVAGRCPLVIVDCKASRSLRAAVEALPNGVVWTIGGPLAWDALRGDRTCFASKLLAAEDYAPNAGVYRASAQRYLQWVGEVLDLGGLPRDPALIAELLAPKALTRVIRETAQRYQQVGRVALDELARIARLVEDLGETEKEGVSGFAARYGVTVEGAIGTSLGTGAGALVLEDALAAGQTLLFSLDAATYPLEAQKVGAWALLDLVRVAGMLQDAGWGDGRQAYFVIDEFGALDHEGRHVVPVMARSREAGIACVVATQGLADLVRVSKTLPQQLVQNAAVRILLRQGSAEDARAWARHGGEYKYEDLSRHVEYAWPFGDRDTGRATTRWRREFYVSPDELHVLGTGEAVVWIAPVGRAKRWIGRVRIAPARPIPNVHGGAQIVPFAGRRLGRAA